MNVSDMTIKQLNDAVGGLSNPSKMPGYGYSLPAKECNTGSKLRKVEGSTCSGCYAMKGRYVFPMVQDALYRRLESLNDPMWAVYMGELINRRSNKSKFFRWHDSGDLQSVEHLEKIVGVCFLTPNVLHWLPTREYRAVSDFIKKHGREMIPKNLNIRFSAHMIGGTMTRPAKPMTISTVSRNFDDYKKAHHCPAPEQGNNCGDCRACWDRKIPHVDYHLH